LKPAEFTDYASASAFVAAGRKKTSRATKDGWNTVLYDRGTHLSLELHGSEIVRYHPSGVKTISIPMRTHVVADRVQRYGLGDKFLLVTSPSKGWTISEAFLVLPGIAAPQTLWVPRAAVTDQIEIDAAGIITHPPLPAMPTQLSSQNRYDIFKPAMKKWLRSVMTKLDAGFEFTEDDWHACPQCYFDPTKKHRGTLSAATGDWTHIRSHVLEGAHPIAMLAQMVHVYGGLQYDSTTPPRGRIGGKSNHRYNREFTRRQLRNQINHLTY
jgi:hypothetical protein